MQLTGTLTVIGETKSFGAKFTKRSFIITTDEKYPQTIELELQGDSVGMIERHKVGDELECEINVRGRAWESPSGETKYFNTLVVWKIKGTGKRSDSADSDVVVDVIDSTIPF